ncbi:sigma-70 family RNA polymerase sigma factor [Reichenbachiella sp. MALMAid0571]|uniref:RNA polymerase sigma factor n=1 Tax=Reichenbachiella sp. MALMAid0571 TaxID=3143939 RepID=UPI0032DFCF70
MSNTDHLELKKLLKACLKNNRSAQKKLYMRFYSYSLSICIRYVNSREEAVEVMNDAFMKVFTYLKQFDLNKPFQPWFRQIIVNCAIDHFKRENKHAGQVDIDTIMEKGIAESQLDNISYEEILALVRELPSAYRAVFNLRAIEGYKHEEIAKMLNITTGTSKSNYFKAKKKLQEYLQVFFEVEK